MKTSPTTESVRVYVRCRPLLPKELSNSSSQCVEINASTNQIFLTDPMATTQKPFTFDGVFDISTTQERLYEECASELVENVLEGYNATIFAYGQTGSGKTYSMMGDLSSETLKGIIPRSFEHILNSINENHEGRTFLITASFLEIYNEEVYDLLKKTADKNSRKCELRQKDDKSFYVQGLSQVEVHSLQDLLKLLRSGNLQRVVGETKMNDKSSRSHAIFKIQVESTKEVKPGVPKISVGKLNLVDLAGSERQEKTQAQGERLKESAAINKSLMQLGNVILALVKGEKFIPYRDSKLTTLLKDSLGGNSKTTMLANINPCTQHYEESIGTLRYANRTKMIMNKPIVNEDPKDALISEYMNQIQKLKEMIDKGGIAQNSETTMEIDQEMLRKIKEEGIKEKEQALEEMEKMKVKELEKFKEQKEKIEVELKQKENSYEKIKLDKEMLEKLLQEKEQALLQGHQVQEDKSKLEEMRKRIIKEKKKQEELRQENRRLEEKLNFFEEGSPKIKEEQNSLKKEFYVRFSAQKSEIDNLKKEKENHLDKIKEKEKDLSFYEELVDLILSKKEQKIIRGQWSLNQYKIPSDLFKDKEIKLPNLTNNVHVDPLVLKDDDDDFDFPINQNKTSKNPTDNSFPEEEKDNKAIILSRHQGEIRKAFLLQNLSNSPCEIIELSQLCRLFLLMKSGIYEVSTPNYCYKVAICPEKERLLGGGLEEMAMDATVQIIKSGIELIVNGNKKEIIESARLDTSIAAQIKIGDEIHKGTYTGPRTYTKKSYCFLCFCPIYCLMTNGDGKFQSEKITYDGKFFNNLFHDNTEQAKLQIGSSVRYTGCFNKGKREGFGKLEKKSDDSLEDYRLVFKGLWKDDKMFKGSLYTHKDNQQLVVENGEISHVTSPEMVSLKNEKMKISSKERKDVPLNPTTENTTISSKEKKDIVNPKAIKLNKVVPIDSNDNDELNDLPKLISKTSAYYFKSNSFQLNLQEHSGKDYTFLREEKLKNPKKELTIEESIGLLIHCISQGQIEAKKAEEKDVIIFIGNTGAGKSTTVNYLYGCKMQLQSAEELGIDVLDPVVTVMGKELMPIGHTKESKTFMPQIENDKQNNFTYIDCPGFLDNRGPEINIANAVNIKNAIKESKSVKVLMLINYFSLKADRARGLSDMLKISTSLFGNSQNLVANKGSIFIGISNAPNTLDLTSLKKFLVKDSPSEMEILADRVFTFDPLERKLPGGWSRTDIISNIRKLEPITTHRKIFSTVLTNEDERKLLEISDEISKKIMSHLDKKETKKELCEEDFKLASKHLSYLQSLEIIEHVTVYRLIEKNRKLIEKTFRDMYTEVFLFSSFEKFEEAEKIIETIQKSIGFFDKTIQSCIDINKVQQTLNEFKEKKLNQEKRDKEFQDKIKSAEDKADETIKLLHEEKEKTEKQLQEHNLTINRLIKESEDNVMKELAKYDEEKKFLEKEYELRLKQKDEQMHLTSKEDQEEIAKEMEKLKNDLDEQKHQLANQKMEYENEQNKIIKDLRDKQEKEKQRSEQKLRKCETMIKEKEQYELIKPEENEDEKLCEEGKSYYFGTKGKSQDFSKALELFDKSAKMMNAEAFYWIGIMYEKGKAVPKNFNIAFKYFKEAACLGYSWGYNKQGQFYQNGDGVEKDEEKSYEMFSLACKHGCSDENLESRMTQLNESKKNKKNNEDLRKKADEYYLGDNDKKPNYEEAFKLYLESSKLGDCNSMYWVAEMYRKGKGVKTNYLEALRYFKMAAELNHNSSCYDLGEMFEKGEGVLINEEEAIKFYTKSFELKYPFITYEKLNELKQSFQNQIFGEELFNQAIDFQNGKNGKTQDFSMALKLYLQAADVGHANSLFSLGEMYKNGFGVENDYKKAFDYSKRAAELGEPKAYLMLGECYHEGYGIKKDFKKALENYDKARDLGLIDETKVEKIREKFEMQKKGEELFNQGLDYELGQNGKEINYKKALKLYMEAGKLGNVDGFYYLACLYRFGNGVEKNWKEALKLYIQSGEMGNESGYYSVGQMYYEGETDQKNYSEALKYFEMADKNNENDSVVYIARIFKEGGFGVMKDKEKALEYYKKALELGVLPSEKCEQEMNELI